MANKGFMEAPRSQFGPSLFRWAEAERGEPGEMSGLVVMLGTIEKESAYMNKIVSELQDYLAPVSLELRQVEMESTIREILSKVHVPSNVRVSVSFSQPVHT